MPVLTRRRLAVLALDLLAVLVFAAVGRRSHGEDVAGLLVTFWPFAVGTLVGHAVVRLVSRAPGSSVGGAVVVVSTVAVGMVLRVLTGAGTAVTFVVVATVVLSAFLLGWRAVAGLVGRRGRGRAR